MRSYTAGNELIYTASFTDPKTGLGINPSDVLLKLRDPTGVEQDIDPLQIQVGVFSATFTPQTAGVWSYRWQGTGLVTAAREGQFNINSSDF